MAKANSGLGSKLKKSTSTAGLPPHVVVQARAGTGKTFTLIEGVKKVLGLPVTAVPSAQQQAVWDSLLLSGTVLPGEIAMVAFNAAIAEELKRRVPPQVEAMTMHSLGFRSVKNAIGRQIALDKDWNPKMLEKVTSGNIFDLRKSHSVAVKSAIALLDMVKSNLSETDDDSLQALVGFYDLEMEDQKGRDVSEQVFEWVRGMIELSKDVQKTNRLSFADMIWLPVVLSLPLPTYKLMVVDEAQDLNRCQQSLVKRAGSRMVFCGDDRQAIYGFAGADSESLPRLTEELRLTDRGVVVLPLTVTRRCGKTIVELAKTIVPDFEAFAENPDGSVERAAWPVTKDGDGNSSELPWEATYGPLVKTGDMVLCRTNAPMISQCFRFIRRGTKATIQGRDIAAGLTALVRKMKSDTIGELLPAIYNWGESEREKEMKKKFPSEGKLSGIADKTECIEAFCEHLEASDSSEMVVAKIEQIFTADPKAPGIRFSSIHRAKGLESDTVFFLQPPGSGGFGVKSAWQDGQEQNLRYVAITRAISRLVMVS